ncbi:MAG: NigD-like C-terminal domain-containing protein, partial [Rikenellaceae bacterium]
LSLVLIILGLTSGCTKDGYDLDNYWLSYGEVIGENPDYKIKLDDGTILNITINRVSPLNVTGGQRVLANYTIVGSEQNSGSATSRNVILNYLYDVLSKSPLFSNEVATPEKQDSLGYDKVDISDAWVSSKYLNIHFDVFRQNPNLRHMVNLVVDKNRSTVSQAYLTFRHNAFNLGQLWLRGKTVYC